MSAAEELGPSTSRSIVVSSPPASNALPATSRIPLFRVAQWLQQVEANKLDMGPGATAIHGLLMVVIAQHQGQNEKCEATARTLGKAALTSESAARDALAELVKAGWLVRYDRKRSDNQWIDALYSISTEPGRPIPARPAKKRSDVPLGGTSVPPEVEPVPPNNTPMVPSGTVAGVDGVPPDAEPCTARRGALYRQTRSPVPPEPNKKIIQEIRKETREKTIAPAPADALARDGESEGTSKPREKRVARSQREGEYSNAYIAGQTDATPGCEFTALRSAECRLLGAVCATHAKINGVQIVGDELLVWIRETSATFRRSVKPEYAKGYSVYAFTEWLNAGRPVSNAANQHAAPDDASRVVIATFAEEWERRKRRGFVQALGDEKHAAALADVARAHGAKLGVRPRDIVRHWCVGYMRDNDKFVADQEHPLRLLPARLTSYGLPSAPKTPSAKPAREPVQLELGPPPELAAALAKVGKPGAIDAPPVRRAGGAA